jgi:hypothetical protein
VGVHKQPQTILAVAMPTWLYSVDPPNSRNPRCRDSARNKLCVDSDCSAEADTLSIVSARFRPRRSQADLNLLAGPQLLAYGPL